MDIEISSGLETILTPCVQFQFVWMGDHWKQEIVSTGGCQAIPRIWSVEGPDDPRLERLKIHLERPGVAVARLEGDSATHGYSAAFTFEELPDGLDVEVELIERGPGAMRPPAATYLIESSQGELEVGGEGNATIAWPHPPCRLLFEAEPPARIKAQESGMGTLRLKALAGPDPEAESRSFRYRWRWVAEPSRQIWDRDV